MNATLSSSVMLTKRLPASGSTFQPSRLEEPLRSACFPSPSPLRKTGQPPPVWNVFHSLWGSKPFVLSALACCKLYGSTVNGFDAVSRDEWAIGNDRPSPFRFGAPLRFLLMCPRSWFQSPCALARHNGQVEPASTTPSRPTVLARYYLDLCSARERLRMDGFYWCGEPSLPGSDRKQRICRTERGFHLCLG